MTGLLVLAHGSREKETEATLETIVSLLQERLKAVRIERAFLQFSDNDLRNGLTKLRDSGIKDIKVIPYFLFEGVHIKEDIPKEIMEFKEEYPDVQITLGRSLGDDHRLAEILADRIQELI